jgi:hypothetical protein
MSVVDSARRLVFLAVLLLTAAIAPAAAQEPTLVRLRDAVGDTIDRAERDSFRLFPNTAGFRYAVILGLPRSKFFAKVAQVDGDTARQIFFHIMPNQLERIRFLIDNREYMAEQLRSNPNAELTLASFWKAIEDRPLRNTAGEPASLPAAGGPRAPLVTAENRFNCTLLGATCGSVAGGCIGSYTSYTLLEPGHYEQTECGPIYVPALYRVNVPALFATSMGVTALGAWAGYAVGKSQDRRLAPNPLPAEGTGWRKGCAGAGALPALALGSFAASAAQSTLYGREEKRYRLENDPDGLSVIPAVLTGLCVSVEVVALAYHIGRSIDRRNAAKAAAETERKKAETRRRELGR